MEKSNRKDKENNKASSGIWSSFFSSEGLPVRVAANWAGGFQQLSMESVWTENNWLKSKDNWNYNTQLTER